MARRNEVIFSSKPRGHPGYPVFSRFGRRRWRIIFAELYRAFYFAGWS